MKWQIVILLVLLVACAKPMVEQAPEQKADISEQVTKSEVTDVAALIATGKPVKCVSEKDGQTTTIYMKGSQMRTDTLPGDAHSINTADRIYTWTGKEGTVMKMEDLTRLPEGAAQQSPPKEKVDTNVEALSPKCEAVSIDESMFTPPADVKFQDMSEALKQAEEAMKAQK